MASVDHLPDLPGTVAVHDVLAEFLAAEREAFASPAGPSAERVKGVRAKRDAALARAEGPAARRRMLRLRDAVAAHDSKVDELLAGSATPDPGSMASRIDALQHRLNGRMAEYARCLEELTPPLLRAHWPAAVVEEVAAYVDEVTELLRAGGAAAAPEVLSVRRARDLRLDLVELTEAEADRPRVRGHLADYDATLDGLITTGTVAEKGFDPEVLDQARQLFLARVTRAAQRDASWLRMWQAGSALGLLAVLVGFFFAARSDPPAWSWLTIGVAGVGALVASLYTFAATRALSARTHWILVALPAVVLIAAVLLPLRGGRFPAVTAIVALCAVLVLGAMSLWVVREEPHERETRSRTSAGWLAAMRTASPEAETKGWNALLVADELENLRSRIQQEARAQGRASITWATTFLVVGGLAALLSGAAGVTANQTDSNDWVAGLAIGGAGLTALMTALNPGRRWEQARTLQLACHSLEQEVGVLIKLDLEKADEADYGRRKVEQIATMYDALLGVPERPRLWRGSPGADAREE